MLEEMFEKYEVVNSVGESLGKIKEIYIDLESWEIRALKISPGLVKSSFLLDIDAIENVDLENHRMIAKDEHEQGEVPKESTRKLYPYDEIQKRQVLDIDGEKVGKIYSLEIPYEKLKVFKIWKLLIKTGFKDRRLRISPSDISNIMNDINLKKKLEEYQESE